MKNIDFMCNNFFVLASKLTDLQKKHPEFSTQIQELSDSDPSENNKYLDWSVKQLKSGANINDIIPTIKIFHKFPHKFKHKDINKYTVKELENEIKELSLSESTKSKREETKELKASGTTKLYEDDDLLLLRINSKHACVEYGKGTKWCITMESESYYEQYSSSNVVFYFVIDKNNPENKVALSVQRDFDNNIIQIEAFDAEDNVISYNNSKVLDIVKKDAPIVPQGNIVKIKNEKLSYDEFMDVWNKADKEERKAIDTIVPEKYVNERIDYLKNLSSDELIKIINNEMSNVKKYIANRIDPKYLPQMMHDESEAVRREVAKIIDPKYLPQMINDKSYYAKVIVVRRIDPKYLPQMMNDENNFIREVVVSRIDPKYLPEMMNDKNTDIREMVAERIDPEYLPEMINDNSYSIRNIVVKRIDPKYLPEMMNDKDSDIRVSVAKKIDPKYLPQMMNDKSDNVQTAVVKRIDPKYLSQIMDDEDYDYYIREVARKRLHLLNNFKGSSFTSKLVKSAIKEPASYSSIMRSLHKKDNKELTAKFQKDFKKAFDDAVINDLENPDKIALMAAMKKNDLNSVDDIVSKQREDFDHGSVAPGFRPQQSFAPETGSQSQMNSFSSSDTRRKMIVKLLKLLSEEDDAPKNDSEVIENVPEVGQFDNYQSMPGGAGLITPSGFTQF